MAKARRLTDAAARKLPSPLKGQVEYFDADVTGLALRISKKDARSWSLLYRVNGKNRRMTLGRYPTLSVKAARQRARDAKLQIADGVDPAQEKQRRQREQNQQEQLTFTYLYERYMREVERGVAHYDGEEGAVPNKRSWKQTNYNILNDVIPHWRDLPLNEIRKRHVLAVLNPILERAPYQANHVFADIRKMFNWAVQQDILEISPCMGLKKPHQTQPRNRPLRDAEIKRLWQACNEMAYPFGSACKVVLLTGQRKGEVFELVQSELDRDNNEWILPAERAKSKRRHVIPLSPIVMELLVDLPKLEGDYLFSDANGTRTMMNISRATKILRDKAELEDFRLHDLRETMATIMRERLSISSDVIGQVLNHAPQGVTQRHYATLPSLKDKRMALEKWGRYVLQVVGLKESTEIIDFPARS